MDILLKLDTVSLDQESTERNELSQSTRDRVTVARERQYERYGNEVCNACVSNENVLESTGLDEEQKTMMQKWSSQHNWSTSVQMKILRLARTISDLGIGILGSDPQSAKLAAL